MTTTATRSVLKRATGDESFLARFHSDPEAALEEYDLAADERDALVSGDESRIRDVLGDVKAEIVVVIVIK